MRTPKFFLAAIAVFCLFAFQSCKKNNDPVPDPVPVIMPDTLSTGWTKQIFVDPSGSGSSYNDIFFNSSTSGYLASSGSLYKSTDGGINWTKLNSVNPNWSNIFVTNDSKAFFVGQVSAIFKTLDGGSNFVNTPIADQASDIFFIDNTTGYCITPSGLYNTIDAGVTWVKLTPNGLAGYSGYGSLSCINNTTGWVVSQSGIYRSVGSFLNWQQSIVSGSTPGVSFGSIYSTSSSNIYAANFAGEIFKSTDGGVNFSFVKKLDSDGFTDLHFLSDLVGYACAGRSVYKTIDGGVNWSKVVSLGQGALVELHFTDATHGWACGNNGVILIFKQ